MGSSRRNNLLKSRRRVIDDGEEEEEGSLPAGVEEDSLSEGSAISDADDDADAEGSDGDDTGSPIRDNIAVSLIANGHQEAPEASASLSRQNPEKSTVVGDITDTEAMMNGLRFSSNEEQGVSFDDLGKETGLLLQSDGTQVRSEAHTTDNIGEKRRRDHEEYKKKRDADPAFVPNRGGFFMHDHRSAAPGQNGFRPFPRGRGRGRGGVGASFQLTTYVL